MRGICSNLCPTTHLESTEFSAKKGERLHSPQTSILKGVTRPIGLCLRPPRSGWTATEDEREGAAHSGRRFRAPLPSRLVSAGTRSTAGPYRGPLSRPPIAAPIVDRPIADRSPSADPQTARRHGHRGSSCRRNPRRLLYTQAPVSRRHSPSSSVAECPGPEQL